MDLPSDDVLRGIVSQYAGLRAAHGDGIGEPPLVLPTAEFFPDEFRPDVPSVARFLRRMMSYAPLREDVAVELAVQADDMDPAGGCGSLACGSGAAAHGRSANLGVDEVDGGYRLSLPLTDVANAEVLAASLGRRIGALVLREAGESAHPATSEMAAVACGFGVLLANGAAVWAKSCGGLRMAQATVLPVEELAVAVALFVAVHRRKASEARAHFGATQREAFDLAQEWVESNPLLVDALRERPAMLEGGLFELEPVRGALGRWIHRRRLEKLARGQAVPPSPAMTEERRRRLEEARALVDEAMAEAEGNG